MLNIDPAWAMATLLLWIRLGVLLGLSPLASALRAPPTFWVVWTLALAGLLCAGWQLRTPVPAHLASWVWLALCEATLGALLGFSLHAAFAALSMAGRLLDLHMGLGMGAVLDPVSQSFSPAMATALTLLGMAVFWSSDGAELMLRGIAYSVQEVPPGAALRLPSPGQLLAPVAAMFTAAIVVIAPVIFILLLLELVFAVLSRILPQMNVMFVGMPAKTLTGLAMAALIAPGLAPLMHRLQRSAFAFWQGVGA
ncbi:flagellar biosynthetic protein FliR [Roseateles sp. DB2]|uniref:flagellar biosynthetic protein FliR n=1 Tax=Roseateles sp. DB2 TaxID=3453717 RepID=UPI003EEEA418